MGIRILKAGMLTTVQDLGRTGYQSQGFSVAGVMDVRSFKIANLLLDNPENEAVMATGVKYFILAAYGEADRCDAMEAQAVDESALVNQPLYNRRPNYLHAPERLENGTYRLCLEYLLADQSGDTPPEERQRAELEIVEQDEQYLVRSLTLS